MEATREQVEKLAYQFYCDRGGVPGYEKDDWLRAERMVAGTGSTPDSEGLKPDSVRKSYSGASKGKTRNPRKLPEFEKEYCQ